MLLDIFESQTDNIENALNAELSDTESCSNNSTSKSESEIREAYNFNAILWSQEAVLTYISQLTLLLSFSPSYIQK